MQILALLLLSLLSCSFAFPECSCANCTPAWGVKDPQTCSGLTISGYPNTCDFDPSNLEGSWYQLYEGAGQGFLQGETCLEWNFDVSGEDLAVTITGRNSDGTQAATVTGTGNAYAIPSFPGKLQIVFTGYETYFPQLIVEEVDNNIYYSSRPLYVVRNDPNNQWIILTDCNCENLFALARSAAPSGSVVSTIQDNYETLGFGTSIVSVSQSCYTSTSSSTTSSSTTGVVVAGSSTSTTSTGVGSTTTTTTTTTSTGIPAPLTTAAIAPIASLTTSPNSPAIMSTAAAPVTPASLTTAASVVAQTGSAGAGSSTSTTSTGVPVVVSSSGSSTSTTSTGMAAASTTTSTGSASMMTTGTTSQTLNDATAGNASLVNAPSTLLCGLLSVLLLVVAGMRS